MFYGIKVLLMETDPATIREYSRVMEAQGFTVVVARTVREALEDMHRCSILIAEKRINGGDADSTVAIEEWIDERKGPWCIISGSINGNEERDAWIVAGAHNVFEKPVSTAVLRSIMMRYGMHVLTSQALQGLGQKVTELENRIRKLTKVIIGLAAIVVVLAIAQGYEGIPALIDALISLI